MRVRRHDQLDQARLVYIYIYYFFFEPASATGHEPAWAVQPCVLLSRDIPVWRISYKPMRIHKLLKSEYLQLFASDSCDYI